MTTKPITGTTTSTAERKRWLHRLGAAFRRNFRYRITRSGYLFGCALVLVGASAVASANNLLFLILAAMLATLMISGFVSRLCLAGLELELILPEHISARQPVSARLRLRNLKWFPSFAIQLSSRGKAAPPILMNEIAFPSLPGRRTIELDAPASFATRGLHRDNLFVIATRFPFGFVERRTTVSIGSEVVVYPALVESYLAGDLLGELRGELEREQRGLGSDFYRIRPYEFHESARHVDWKSSAHAGELQVREFSREERSSVYLFFDTHVQPGAAFERAVECCAFLIWTLSAESTRIRFRTQTADLNFPDQVDVYEILRELALIEPISRLEIPVPDEDDPHLLLTASPSEFESAGWRADRIVSPEDFDEPNRGLS